MIRATRGIIKRMADEPTSDPGDDDAAFLTAWLRERDVKCRCGYNLRNLQSDRCPECGVTLRLTVAMANNYGNAWKVCAAVTLAAAGVGSVVLYIVAVSVAQRSFFPTSSKEIALVAFFLSSFPVAAMVVTFRRQFHRLQASIQWLLAGIGGAYFLMMVAALVPSVS